MTEPKWERVDFVIVDDSQGYVNTLACPKCGNIFDINAHTNENLAFDREFKGMVARCPDCGVVQRAEEDDENA